MQNLLNFWHPGVCWCWVPEYVCKHYSLFPLQILYVLTEFSLHIKLAYAIAWGGMAFPMCGRVSDLKAYVHHQQPCNFVSAQKARVTSTVGHSTDQQVMNTCSTCGPCTSYVIYYQWGIVGKWSHDPQKLLSMQLDSEILNMTLSVTFG